MYHGLTHSPHTHVLYPIADIIALRSTPIRLTLYVNDIPLKHETNTLRSVLYSKSH